MFIIPAFAETSFWMKAADLYFADIRRESRVGCVPRATWRAKARPLSIVAWSATATSHATGSRDDHV